MSRLRVVWLLLGVSALGGMVLLFVLPTRWEVSRERIVAAPPEAVWPHLVELRRWNAWSPWQEKDYPGLEFHYAGPPAGAASRIFTWYQITKLIARRCPR